MTTQHLDFLRRYFFNAAQYDDCTRMSLFAGLSKEYGPNDNIPTVWLPFKHRYSRLAIYALMLITTSGAYAGWQALQNILVHNKTYQWLCPEHFDFTGENNYCRAQYKALQNFYFVAYACEFSFSLASGFMYDYLGPMITGLVGQGIFSVGWLLLVYSSESFNLNIIAAMCLGGAVNLIAYPTLVVSALFPNHSALAMSFVVACQTTAPIVPVVFGTILKSHSTWTLSNVVWMYLCFVVFPLTVLFALALPVTRKTVTLANASAQKKLEPPTELTHLTSRSSDGNCVKEEGPLHLNLKVLMKDLMTLRWWLFTIYYTVSVMQYSYYTSTVLDQAGQEVSDFQAKFFPTQAIWGILFGVVIEYTKTLPMCSFLTSCVILMLTLAYFPTIRWLQYLNQVVYVVSNSYIYTVKYTYCEEQWPPLNFGMLVGVMASLSGVFSLLNLAFLERLTYIGGITMYLVLACGCFAILIGLFFYVGKKNKAKFAAPATSTAECLKF